MQVQFRVHHTAISVQDMAEAIDFYRIFGFTVVTHYRSPGEDLEIAHLALDSALLEIFWYRDHTPAPDTASELSTDLCRIGVKHFALRVERIEDAKRFVEERCLADRVEIQQGRTGVRYFFLKDPSGNLFEILEPEKSATVEVACPNGADVDCQLDAGQ